MITGQGTVHALGADHYLRTGAEYFEQHRRDTPFLDQVLGVRGNPIKQFFDGLRPQVCIVRPARWLGREMNTCIIRSFSEERGCVWALRPHEDLSQLSFPAQLAAETAQLVAGPVAVSVVLRAPPQGTSVVVWAGEPTADERGAASIPPFAGLPYPDAMVAGRSRLELTLGVGDLYCLNGRLLHAVPACDPPELRLTLACFAGMLATGEIVYWA